MPIGASEEEAVPLVKAENETLVLLRAQTRQGNVNSAAVLLVLVVAMLVLLSTGLLVWRLNNTVASVQSVLMPHASAVVNSTVSFLNDMGGSMYNMRDISELTGRLAHASMEPMQAVVNNSKTMSDQAVHLMGHADSLANSGVNSTAAALSNAQLISDRLAEMLLHPPTISISVGGAGR